MDKRETWYHCILYDEEPYKCFGFASINGVVSQAAPIVSWMVGKELKKLRSFFIDKNALVTEVK